MSKGDRYQYYVEGDCEKKLIGVFKEKKDMILPGKVEVFNVMQQRFTDTKLRLLSPGTIVILVFDTDKSDLKILKENIECLKKNTRIKDIWLVLQVNNMEDELIRATDIREIKDLLGCESNKDFKHCFIQEKNLYGKLQAHRFDFTSLWNSNADGEYSGYRNDGEKIKIRKAVYE